MFLIFLSEPGEAPCITSAGFQFLLLDTASQLWYFTLQYLKTAQVVDLWISSHKMYHKKITCSDLMEGAVYTSMLLVGCGNVFITLTLLFTVKRYGPGGDSFLFVPAEFFHSRSGEFCFRVSRIT